MATTHTKATNSPGNEMPESLYSQRSLKEKRRIKRGITVGIVLLILLAMVLRFLYIANKRGQTIDIASLDVSYTDKTVLPPAALIEPQTELATFETPLETERFALHVKPFNGEIAVTDKSTEEVWTSTPEDAIADPYAVGGFKLLQMSQVMMDYRTDTGVIMTTGSLLASVGQKGMTYEAHDDHVVMTYDFPKEEISVCLEYRLTDSGLQVTVPSESIREYGTNTVMSLRLLPAFGAGKEHDKGFIFVPDGSGGIIPFGSEMLQAAAYRAPIYGSDAASDQRLAMTASLSGGGLTYDEPIRLPVFGISRNDHAWLAVVSEGSPRGVIHADIAGRTMAHNIASAEFHYRRLGYVELQQQGAEDSVNIFPEAKPSDSDFTVDYLFLPEGESAWIDMAHTYQTHLVDAYDLEPLEETTPPFYLELYGYVPKQRAFAGIPYRASIPLTTAEDAEEMVDSLGEQGVERVHVRLKNWVKNSVYRTTPVSAKPLNSLGNWSIVTSKLNQGGFWYDADLIHVPKSNMHFSQYTDAVLNASGIPLQQHRMSLDSSEPDPLYGSWYLLSPTRYPEHYARYVRNLRTGKIAFTGLGDELYSDYSKQGVGRDQVPTLVNSVLDDITRSRKDLLLDQANSYALAYADHVLNSPIRSSEFDLVSHNVPFYQAVLRGYIEYSLPSTNLSSDPELMKLMLLETGAAPLFTWIGRNFDEVHNTQLAGDFSMDYRIWLDYSADLYAELKEVLGEHWNEPMAEHVVISENVRRVRYGDLTLYLNYGSKDVRFGETVIPARSYLEVKS